MTELNKKINDALIVADTITNYVDTILGDAPLDTNDDVNITLDVDEESKIEVKDNIIIIK